MNIDDVYLVLHHHWALDTTLFPDGRQRLQIAFLILLSAYTASRPGALVYVARNVKADKSPQFSDDDPIANTIDGKDDNDPVKTICYEDVTLTLLPNPTGLRDLLAMEVNLRYTKGNQRKGRR